MKHVFRSGNFIFFLYHFHLNVKLQFRAQTIKKGVAGFRTYLEIQTRNRSQRATIPSAIHIKEGFVFFYIEVTALRVLGLKNQCKMNAEKPPTCPPLMTTSGSMTFPRDLDIFSPFSPRVKPWTTTVLRRQIGCYNNQHNNHDHFEDDLSLSKNIFI